MEKVKLAWISHLKDKDDREAFKKRLLSCSDVFERLEAILVDKLNSLEPDIKDYDSPSWAYRQAHINGMKEVLFDLIDILPLTEGSNE